MPVPVPTTDSVDADVFAAVAALLGLANAPAPLATTPGTAAPAPSPLASPVPSAVPFPAPSSPRLAASAQDTGNEANGNEARNEGDDDKVERSGSTPLPSPFPWPVNDASDAGEDRHEVLDRMIAIAGRLHKRAGERAVRVLRRSPDDFPAAIQEFLDAGKLIRFLVELAL